MDISHVLRDAIENQLKGKQQEKMMNDAQTLSLRYRTESGKGKRLITCESEAMAYAVARMPATYGAVYNAIQQAMISSDCRPETLLDVGAGTGAATWAADAQLELKEVVCLERENVMIHVGETMMKQGSKALVNAKWKKHDFLREKITEKADLVIASYVLNEMAADGRIEAVKKLWDATSMMLIIVEPGTPADFSNIIEIRKALIEVGANLVAPCPHQAECPKSNNDWCHFSCRINRTRLHRQLKKGVAPYEDEKFTYVVATRDKCNNIPIARVLRHPEIRSGYVMLEVCTVDGIKDIKFSKKDGEKYKQARKAKTGDAIEY